MIRIGSGGRRPGKIAAVALLALAALAASSSAGLAQQSDSLLKKGAKLLGFATDVAPPADFVVTSRPTHDVDFIPLFQPPPEPARPAMKAGDLKSLNGDLESASKQADALRRAYPPAAKALAQQEAAKKNKALAEQEAAAKKQPSTAPNAQQ